MKSPFTGKEMKLCKEQREIQFRKEAFEVTFHYFRCEDSGEQFTNTELDELNLGQAYNQFRSRHRLPFPEEIKEIRERYGLSAAKMSEILGFGVNVYRQYEIGEVPSESNARLIQLARDPQQFSSLVQMCTTLDPKAQAKLQHRIQELLAAKRPQDPAPVMERFLLGPLEADEYSGYRRPNVNKFAAMVFAFAKALHPLKTKLNKLLFYADFIHFSKTCHSISGMRYEAIKFGPVPQNFQSLYALLEGRKAISIEYQEYENGAIGERFTEGEPMNLEPLDAAELATIDEVIARFRSASTNEIVFESHLERGWRESIDQPNRTISYQKYAFLMGAK